MLSEREVALVIRAKNMTARAFKAVTTSMTRTAKVGKKTARILTAGFKAVRKTIRAVAGAFKAALKAMIIPLAVLGLGFIAAVRQAGSFQQSMANVASVLGSSQKEMQRLSDAAREMGKTSVFNAQEAASAMYDLASAGFSADQVIDALRGTMLLAAATASDLTFVTEAVTSTLKQFDLSADSADRVANAFAAVISFSKMNMDKLKTSMAYAGPVAAGFGHKLEGTLSVLAAFANLGLEASMIGTSFRMGLLQLQRAMPVEEIEKGADVLKRLKIQFKDIDPATKSVADIVERLHGRVTGMTEAVALFGVRAGGPWLKLIKAGPAPLREFEKRITGTRKAFEMSAIQIGTFYGGLKLFKSAIQEAQISLGTAFLPALTKIVDTFTHWVNIINQIDWSTLWKSFTEGVDTGVEKLDNLLDLFRSGGPFRKAAIEWLKFFVDAVSSVAKVIWIPLETELKVLGDKMLINFKEQIGGMLRTIPGLGRAGGRLLGRAKYMKETFLEREEIFRGRQRARQTEAFQRLLATRPTPAVGATEQAIGEFVTVLRGPQMAEATEKTAQTVKEEKKVQETWMATVIDSQGRMQGIMMTSLQSLNRRIDQLKSQTDQLDVKIRRVTTSGMREVGAFQ